MSILFKLFMAEKRQRGKLDADGKQTHLGRRYTPDELAVHLRQCKRAWDGDFDVVIDAISGLCMLRCKACLVLLSATNPSGSTLPHKRVCKGGVFEADDEAGSSQIGTAGCRYGNMGMYMATAAQQGRALRHLLLHAMLSETPLKRLGSKQLKKSYAAMGVKLPCADV
jgi:hypothetical protein